MGGCKGSHGDLQGWEEYVLLEDLRAVSVIEQQETG